MNKSVSLALVASLLALPSALAFNPQPDPPGFGMFGITRGQTLRLNVSNVPAANPLLPPDPCRVELSFRDSAGNAVLPAVQRLIAPGVTVHADLNGDALFPVADVAGPVRLEVRPVIKFLPNFAVLGASLIPPGPCLAMVEIIERSTGRTLVASGPQKRASFVDSAPPEPDFSLLGLVVEPPPDPDKTFGVTGVALGQTARINVVNAGEVSPLSTEIPPPCRVTITFFNAAGDAISRFVTTLQPGQATLHDFSPGVTTNLPGTVAPPDPDTSQVHVRAVVAIVPLTTGAHPPDPCRATFEVFDNTTGKTSTVLSSQRPALNPPPEPE